MKKLKRTLAVLLTVAAVLTLTACGNQPGSTSNGGAPAQVATYLYKSIPLLDCDPSVEFSDGIITMNNIYETLLYYDMENDKLEPRLATEYSHSEDGLVWTFKIRKGVKFHDGTTMDAEAVKFSIDRTMKKGMGASFIWDPVSEIKVVDSNTVEFHLKYPAALDMIAATGYAAFIYSPTAVSGYGDIWPEGAECGTGPYIMQSYTPGEEIILSKFEDYWRGWDGEHFDKAVIRKVTETASRRQMMEKGDGDITYGLPETDVKDIKNAGQLTVDVASTLENVVAMLNCERAPLDNPLVRQALAYAFPYQDVVDYAVGGYATQATGAIPAGLWGHSDDLFQYSFDPDKALELLAQAGVDPSEIHLLLTYSSGDEALKKMSELYKSELAKIGIELEIRAMSWDTQWEVAKGNESGRQDIFLIYWWPDTASPFTWLFNLFHSEDLPAYNLNYYYNKTFDKIVDDANVMAGIDRAAAEKEFIRAQEILLEDCPSIFVYDNDNVWIKNPTFKGHKENPVYPGVVFFYDCYRGQ